MERSFNYNYYFCELIHTHFNYTQDFQEVFAKLGEDYAEMNNLPDSKFNDAYMAFRSRVEEAIRFYWRVSEESQTQHSQGLFRSVTPVFRQLAASGTVWATKFFLSEGVLQPRLRDPNTFSLDPAPFKDMIKIIRKKSTPDYSEVFTGTHSTERHLTNLKRFAKGIIKTVSFNGPTQAIVQKQFYDGVSNIIDSIEAISESKEVNKVTKQYSVEVKKGSGAVVLGSYVSSFKGEVSINCCSKSGEVTMKVAVKVWKFSTLGQLKDEFMRLNA